MKRILLISIFNFLAGIVLSQNGNGTLTVQDLSTGKDKITEANYLIRHYNSDIIDVRTGKVIGNEQYAGKFKEMKDGSLLYKGQRNSGSYLQYYDSNLKKGGKIDFDGQLSPNYEYSIIVDKGDLYRSTYDVNAKKFKSPEKITDLGVFKGNYITFLYWYKDIIIFKGPDGMGYVLNTLTRDLSNLPSSISIWNRNNTISPTGRYVIVTTNDRSSSIYDIEKGELLNYNGDGFLFWNDIDTYSTISAPSKKRTVVLKTQTIGSNNYADLLIHSWERKVERQPIFLMPLDMMWESRRTNTSDANYERARIFPNQGFIYLAKKPNDLFYKDITTGELTMMSKNDEMWDYDCSNMSGGCYGNFVWVNDKEIIFTRSRNLLKQGTFIFNIETKQSIKLSNNIADDFFRLPSTEFTVFVANNILYKYNAKTKQMLEICPSTRSRLVYGDDQLKILTEEYSIK
jgi:hypothetical protein